MRQVPLNFLKASYAEETDNAFIALITIGHPELAAPIRVSTDSKDTMSRGNQFVSYPVQPYLPADEDGRAPSARLVIDNLDRDISAALHSITTPATVWIEMVLSNFPDEVVTIFSDFRLQRVTYDAMTIEGELTLRQYGREPFPAPTFSPGRFPNIYRAI